MSLCSCCYFSFRRHSVACVVVSLAAVAAVAGAGAAAAAVAVVSWVVTPLCR